MTVFFKREKRSHAILTFLASFFFFNTPPCQYLMCRVTFRPFFVTFWINYFWTKIGKWRTLLLAQTSSDFNVKNALTHQSIVEKSNLWKYIKRDRWIDFSWWFFAVGLISEEWSVSNRMVAQVKLFIHSEIWGECFQIQRSWLGHGLDRGRSLEAMKRFPKKYPFLLHKRCYVTQNLVVLWGCGLHPNPIWHDRVHFLWGLEGEENRGQLSLRNDWDTEVYPTSEPYMSQQSVTPPCVQKEPPEDSGH